MSIAENGPLLHQADPILRRAMNKYWDGRPWHFIRKTGDIRLAKVEAARLWEN